MVRTRQFSGGLGLELDEVGQPLEVVSGTGGVVWEAQMGQVPRPRLGGDVGGGH